jgi:hypothetical protein
MSCRQGWRLSLDVSNHADADETPDESVTLDGESYRLTLASRLALGERIALGIDVPLVWHSGGFLDGPIERWHDFWGLSNARRSGPRDQLAIRYANVNGDAVDLRSPDGGLGDVQVFAALQLGGAATHPGRGLGLRAGIKLPTGDAGRLLGSGAFDTWFEGNAVLCCAFGPDRLRLSASAGLLIPGKGDLLPDIQRDVVGFGGLGAGLSLGRRFELLAQLHAQSAYYNSSLEPLGGHSVQLVLGGRYTLEGAQSYLGFALVEDLFGNATTDVAFQVSMQGYVGRSAGSGR